MLYLDGLVEVPLPHALVALRQDGEANHNEPYNLEPPPMLYLDGLAEVPLPHALVAVRQDGEANHNVRVAELRGSAGGGRRRSRQEDTLLVIQFTSH